MSGGCPGMNGCAGPAGSAWFVEACDPEQAPSSSYPIALCSPCYPAHSPRVLTPA